MAVLAQRRPGASGGGAGRRKISWTAYLFILPHLIFFLVFVGWPFISGLWISFHRYDIARPRDTTFVGVDNYVNIFTPDNVRFNTFWNALINTLEFVLYSVPPLIVLPLLLAVLLNVKVPGRNIFRGIYFAPWVLSVAVIGILWWWIFQSQGGLITYYWGTLTRVFDFLMLWVVPPILILLLLWPLITNRNDARRHVFSSFRDMLPVIGAVAIALFWAWMLTNGGLINESSTSPRWLSSMPWAWVALVVATVWWTVGFNMIIFLAALQDIPDQLYEAASIDGATRMQQFFRITLPMLRPVMVFVVTITIIASFNLFGQPFFMTRGNPPEATGGGATEPVMYRIYIEGFTGSPDQGRASAMVFVVAMLMIIVSYVNFRVFRNREPES
jgi:multiple sugar transport system permease protein